MWKYTKTKINTKPVECVNCGHDSTTLNHPYRYASKKERTKVAKPKVIGPLSGQFAIAIPTLLYVFFIFYGVIVGKIAQYWSTLSYNQGYALILAMLIALVCWFITLIIFIKNKDNFYE